MTFSGVISHLKPYYNRILPGCVVLCYHRVAENTVDRWRNVVSVKNFRAHMQFISRKYLVVLMDQLIESLKRGKLPGRRTVVVTFDDGYAINTRYACSILSDEKIPATFYMNTYWLGQEEYFWWDELQQLLVDGNECPESIMTEIASQAIEFPYVTKSQQDHFFLMIQRLFKGLDQSKRREILDQLSQVVPKHSNHMPEREPITSGKIRELSGSELFEIGGHTHSHCALSLLSPEEQQVEIVENKKILESLTGKAIRHFSYPFGGHDDFDENTTQMVREAGYSSAATMVRSPLRSSGDVYGIPRISVKDWDGARFGRELRDLFAR